MHSPKNKTRYCSTIELANFNETFQALSPPAGTSRIMPHAMREDGLSPKICRKCMMPLVEIYHGAPQEAIRHLICPHCSMALLRSMDMKFNFIKIRQQSISYETSFGGRRKPQKNEIHLSFVGDKVCFNALMLVLQACGRQNTVISFYTPLLPDLAKIVQDYLDESYYASDLTLVIDQKLISFRSFFPYEGAYNPYDDNFDGECFNATRILLWIDNKASSMDKCYNFSKMHYEKFDLAMAKLKRTFKRPLFAFRFRLKQKGIMEATSESSQQFYKHCQALGMRIVDIPYTTNKGNFILKDSI